MVSRVENFVVDEYRKGGVTKQAKERLDKAIDSLHKLASRNQQPPPGTLTSERSPRGTWIRPSVARRDR